MFPGMLYNTTLDMVSTGVEFLTSLFSCLFNIFMDILTLILHSLGFHCHPQLKY